LEKHCKASEEIIGKFLEDYRINKRDNENCDFGEEFEDLVDKIENDEEIN
jgi:hypothetical protein